MGQVTQRMNRTLEAVHGIPGVTSGGDFDRPSRERQEYPIQFHIAGQDTESESAKIFADSDTVSPDYFRVLGIPLAVGQYLPSALRYERPSAGIDQPFISPRNTCRAKIRWAIS